MQLTISLIAALLFAAPVWALTSHNIPDFCASPTRTASVTGNWNDTATWGGQSVPGAGAVVKINNGVTVTYNVDSSTALKAVCTSGLLTFGTSGTLRMVTSELLVYSDGELRIGTEGSPFTGSATIEFSGTLDTGTVESPGTDPSQWGVGMIVIGKIRVHGSTKTPYVRLTANANSGATSVSLASTPTAWNNGDEVVIPESEQRKFGGLGVGQGPAFEEFNGGGSFTKKVDRRTLTANVTGTSASLSSALTYNHPCGLDGSSNCSFYPHIANLTRNIVFKSTSPAGVRGHTLTTDRADVDIRYALFKDMGRTTLANLHCTLRTTGTFAEAPDCTEGTGTITQIGTNQKGRYAVHFHHTWGPVNAGNTGYQGKFIGNAVVDSTKWPVAVHKTSYFLIQDNVVAFGFGPAIFLEEYDEHFNVFEGNLMTAMESNVDPRNATSFQEMGGREAAGFWTRGYNNYVRNNIAAGNWNTAQQIITDVGFKYATAPQGRMTRVPDFRGADLSNADDYTEQQVLNMALLEFSGNEVYGMGAGMTVWQNGTDGFELQSNHPVSTVTNLKVWNVYEQGFFAYPLYNWIFDGMVMRGDPAKVTAGVEAFPIGWGTGDYKGHTITIRNGNFMNVGRAIGHTEGMDGPFTYEDSVSKGAIGVDIWAYNTPGTQSSPLNNREITIRNVTHSTIAGRDLVTIQKRYDPRGQCCAGNFYGDTLPETVSVIRYQGGSQNFNVYYDEQISQNVAGGLAPCNDTTTFPEIDGVVCNVTTGGRIPTAPRNLQVSRTESTARALATGRTLAQ